MALTKEENLVIEAITNMLQDNTKLGLSTHKHLKGKASSFGAKHMHEYIDSVYSLEASKLLHSTAICGAFSKVHAYKFIDDPLFEIAFEKELTGCGVPHKEIEKSKAILQKVIKRLESENSNEHDFGFHPELDEIEDICQPKVDHEFKIIDTPLNKRNIKGEVNDTSPGKLTH